MRVLTLWSLPWLFFLASRPPIKQTFKKKGPKTLHLLLEDFMAQRGLRTSPCANMAGIKAKM